MSNIYVYKRMFTYIIYLHIYFCQTLSYNYVYFLLLYVKISLISDKKGGIKVANSLDKNSIGSRIRLIRKSLKMTMKEFGDFLGDVPQSIISRWENGTSIPNNERLSLISEKCNVSITYLLEGKKTLQDLRSIDEVHSSEDLRNAFDYESRHLNNNEFVIRLKNNNGQELFLRGDNKTTQKMVLTFLSQLNLPE